MGVKDLWNVLSPLCETKPLFELQGKTIAIDLSCWIVDSQSVTDNAAQPKMYLRNLYFRTSYLLLQGISPVFVLEGKAPDLKHKTIAQRNDTRRGIVSRVTANKGGRSRFNNVLRECEKMLKYMGLACVQGYGEAEAMCAYLNEDGLVDGCVSQDSDCFLYGANVVYRNFCASQGNKSASGGAIDKYTMEKIEQVFNLNRRKMIAMALLCGCDYGDGVSGVGKEAALKLFKFLDKEGEDVLDRIKSWRTDKKFDMMEAELSNSNICTSCGHLGKIRVHAKTGCVDCGTFSKCKESYKERRAFISNEVSLRKKALLIEDFPNQELIDEFLVRKGPVPTALSLEWKQPQIIEFVHFMERQLGWAPEYTVTKILPLATRWQLLHLPAIMLKQRLSVSHYIVPVAIKKIRNIRCIASYEVLWKAETGNLKELLEQVKADNNDETNILEELITIEPQNMVQNCYPDLVKEFDDARNAKKKKKPVTSRRKKAATVLSSENEETVPESKATRRKRENKPSSAIGNRKIDEFMVVNKLAELEESFGRLSVTPKRSKQENKNTKKVQEKIPCKILSTQRKQDPQIERVLATERVARNFNNTLDKMFDELTPEDFASDPEEENLNMSEIIQKICSTDRTNTNAISCETPVRNVPPEQNLWNHESADEFDELNITYVPLSQRLTAS
ncbi:flap endonuclease GEN isoform X2 [Cephus cinctus]|uniref:Flap endonuclease GEN isoform X2 n=1 Tax=Cephus cinctus TaxID=211228 RepID=A0AAJ7FJG1_CEPCN|nr:flap endonuclease GEN isoform X2 [Cephus cinctus]